jgi:hypothetical protein
MNYFVIVSDTHEKALQSNYPTSGPSDDDEAAAVLAADFSRWADDVSPETEMMIESSNKPKAGDIPAGFGQMSFMRSDNVSLKAMPDAKPTLAAECKTAQRRQSYGFELKRPTDARSHADLNKNKRSAHERAPVPVFSTWTKQESSQPTKRAHTWQEISSSPSPPMQESSPPTKRAHTWQEISSEINRFAEENMRNAGWEDLWTNKKKAQGVDETLSYLSAQSLQDIRKAEMVFQDSLESQQKLQAWDKMMGLKRCHSRTMTKSSITRKKLLQSVRELKIIKERETLEIDEGQGSK